MEKIKNIHAREILDSRGNPTVECDIEFRRWTVLEELLFQVEHQQVFMKL